MIQPTRFFRPRFFLALLGIAVLAPSALGQGLVNVVASDPQVRQVVAADTAFGFRMLGQLSRSAPSTNVFFSPFGVSNSLTVVLNGPGGDAQRDVAAALGVGAMTPEQINLANGLLLPAFAKADPKVQVSVANALWAGKDTSFTSSFEDLSLRFYGARIEALDFDSPDAADTINAWVKDSTRGKIPHVVSTADLSGMTAVLTNAVYFQGTWQHKFTKAATQPGPFTLETGGMKTLPLMAQVETFLYLDTPEFQAASLPYGGGRWSFYVVLPKAGHDLNEFVGVLNADAWEGWTRKMKPTLLKLTLPCFKVDYQATLNPALNALGMASVFRPGADFTPMGLQGSFLSAVVHKAVLDVDEYGTVAAAATAVFGFAGGGGPPPIMTIMRVDHPFFCAIRDNVTGVVLFAGVIRDPS